MNAGREKAKPQKPQQEVRDTEQKPVENQRKEKLADFMIDVAKYVFTGVIITSLFNDVSDKTLLYVIGIGIVVFSLWGGLLLTNKRKGN